VTARVHETLMIMARSDEDMTAYADRLSFAEKIFFLCTPTASKPEQQRIYLDEYAKMPDIIMDADEDGPEFVGRKTENRAFFEWASRRGLIAGDIWNRTGVMTLFQRQKIVERLAGKSFGPPPKNVADEERWFSRLMNDPEFRKHYDRIDWNSPAFREAFERASVRNMDRAGKKTHEQ
jgi:hypothetical protein